MRYCDQCGDRETDGTRGIVIPGRVICHKCAGKRITELEAALLYAAQECGYYDMEYGTRTPPNRTVARWIATGSALIPAESAPNSEE